MRQLDFSTASSTSKFSDVAFAGYRKQLIQGKTSGYDRVFPLIDQVVQNVDFKRIVFQMSYIFMMIQFYLVSIWPLQSFWAVEKGVSIIKGMTSIFWGITSFSGTGNLVQYGAILFGLMAFIWCFILSVLINYNYSRRFVKWTLYPILFIYKVLSPIGIHFSASYIGSCLYFRATNGTVGILPFVFGFFVYLSCCMIFQIAYSLESSSIFLRKSVYAMFNPYVFQQIIIYNSVVFIFMYLFLTYSDWTIIVIQAIHGVVCVYLLKNTLDLPFLEQRSNILTSTIITSALFNDIVLIANRYFGIQGKIPLVFIIIGVFFVFCIIFYFYISKKVKSIITDLSSSSETITDNEKTDKFYRLGLDKSLDRGLMYLHVGFVNACDLFLDWSLLKFLISVYPDNHAICSAIRILSLFPCETRLLNSFFSIVTSKRDLCQSHRFLVYEVHRVKTLRQSSTSLDANERLNELKSLSLECKSQIHSFWFKKEIEMKYLEAVSSEFKSVKSLWEEGIHDYPNNQKFADEYCTFLIESLCDFEASIVMKHRCSLIEMGKNYAIDLSFNSFVRTYPGYIKRGIIDLKGSFKSKSLKNGSNSLSEKNFTVSTDDSFMEVEVEESIGNQILKQPKMRLALSRALHGRSTGSIRALPLLSVLNIVFVVSAFLIAYYYLTNSFESRTKSMERVDFLMKTRFYNAISGISLVLNYANKTNRFFNYTNINDQIQSDYNATSFLPLDQNLQQKTIDWTKQSRKSLRGLFSHLASLAMNGNQVFQYSHVLLDKGVGVNFCYDGNIISYQETDLGSVYLFSHFLQGHLVGISDQTDLFNNSYHCELFSTWPFIMNGTDRVMSMFSDYQVVDAQNLHTSIERLLDYAYYPLFLLIIIPILICSFLFRRESKKLANILLSFDDQMKKDCTSPIRKDIDGESDQIFDNYESKSSGNAKVVLIGVFGIGSYIILISMISHTKTRNESLTLLNSWMEHAAIRNPLVAEALQHTLYTLLLNGSIFANYTTASVHKIIAKNSLLSLDYHNQQLLQGNSTMKPCSDYDEELDQYNLKDTCVITQNASIFHDLYRCASSSQALGLLTTMLTDILQKPSFYNGRLDNDEILHSIHMSSSHLWTNLEKASDRLVKLASIEYGKMVNTMVLYVVGGISIGFVLSFLAVSLSYTYSSCYEVLLTLIKRVPPIHIVNDKKLLDILMNRESYNKKLSLSVSANVIHSSLDAILCTGLNGVVEMVNPAVSSLLGYTPEQLLGQPISAFFSENYITKINSQIGLMKDSQCSHVFEDHVCCLSDGLQEIPCNMTILGMKNSGESVIKSFVFILRDESTLINKQTEAENAKIKSEKLLFEILPRDIVTRLNRGEKEICFSIPSASIIFIDIVKFSDYTSSLTPQEIMSNLSLIFSSFDAILLKYPLVTRIKLIGDVYMAASGLFGDVSPKDHASQIVKFALDVLQEFDDINLKLNANLSIRVGINTGGPILAGVLGSEKPVFDIIGDPINIASRLQSTSLPGRIQVSQSTYDLISDMSFEIEKRGEVFLKGKGDTTAYFVNPSHNFFVHLSNEYRRNSDINESV